MAENRDSLPDHSGPPVDVWTIHSGTMGLGWPARVRGPQSAISLEVVPAITLWDAYRETCDGVPLPFGAWMSQQGYSDTVREVRELREAYDTTGEQLTEAEAERDRLRAENETLKGLYDEMADVLADIVRYPWRSHPGFAAVSYDHKPLALHDRALAALKAAAQQVNLAGASDEIQAGGPDA